jgi:hypothetical protein
VDGSFFPFVVTEDGTILAQSKTKPIDLDEPAGMFQPAIDHVKALAPQLRLNAAAYDSALWFYCEYLRSPKHNTLAYERTPQNHLVLFDMRFGEGRFVPANKLGSWAKALDIDCIPVLLEGEVTSADIEALLTTPSYLGGETVEGVVIKNANEWISIGPRVYPLFTKWVRPNFKERNAAEWKGNSSVNRTDAFIASFQSEARWRKAVEHLRDQGELLCEPKDIGALIKAIETDVIEEESANIGRFFCKLYLPEILRTARRGFPEWYKQWLREREETAE